MRVYELARELGVRSKDLLVSLEHLGHAGKTASSNVPERAIEPLRALRRPAAPAGTEPTRPQPVANDGVAIAIDALDPERPAVDPFGRAPSIAVEGSAAPELDLDLLPDPVPEQARPQLTLVPPTAPEMPVPFGPGPTERLVRIGRRLGRWAAMVAMWIVLGFGAGLLVAITVPYLFGYRSLTVLSGSMAPAFHAGDVVVVSQIAPIDARVGDVVSFRDPADGSRLITHRVRRVERAGDRVVFVTKGDANTSVEQWEIAEHGTLGRVSYRIPKIGYALFWVRGPLGRLLLVVLPALLLGAYELHRIWRTPAGRTDAATA